ncbi:MAG TPA: hypothetical protein VG937_26430 [Polyangiaceae bacterium]|nr:hypothetical protein [Polyangiaceae bacterium]
MRSFAMAFVAAVSLVSGVANALEPGSAGSTLPAAEPSSAMTPPATAEADKAARAAQLYRDAEAKYVAGDLTGALAQMQLCYEVSGITELLFNLAQLHQELEQCKPALATYREYLARNAEPSRRDDANRAIAELSRRCPEPPSPPAQPAVSPRVEAPKAAAPPPVAPIPPRYWTPMRTAGWSSIAGAVLAGSGAAYLAIQAANDEQALEQRLRDLRSSQAGFDEADKQRENAGQRAATWAQVLGVSAAALTTVGVTLLVIAAPEQEAQSSALSLEFGSGSLSARYSRAF